MILNFRRHSMIAVCFGCVLWGVVAGQDQWVRMGAPDPRTEATKTSQRVDAELTARHWAYKRPQNIVAPAVKADSWPRNDIDRFVLNAIEEKGLSPVSDADRATLLRRFSYDITGLPPSADEIKQFASVN